MMKYRESLKKISGPIRLNQAKKMPNMGYMGFWQVLKLGIQYLQWVADLLCMPSVRARLEAGKPLKWVGNSRNNFC